MNINRVKRGNRSGKGGEEHQAMNINRVGRGNRSVRGGEEQQAMNINRVGRGNRSVRGGEEQVMNINRKFLLLEELPPAAEREGQSQNNNPGADPSNSDNGPSADQCYLELKNVTAKWDVTLTEANTLDDVSLRVGPAELMAVIGPVGSGKSSLLMTILGELQPQSGSVKSRGTVAYVSQQPWVFSGSVRQNIVFGGKFEKAKYDKIIKVTALSRDLTIMPNGDATLIGDRGVSLSGGQRARVSLARALYMDADIYLLDDPLSAVDAAVGRHIFDKCIVKYLKNKPRILVTHQVQFLPVADSIFILKEGKINSQGSFTELSQSGVDFSELLKQPDEEEDVGKQHSKSLSHQHSSGSHHTLAVSSLEENHLSVSLTSLQSMIEDYVPEPVQLPDEEERAQGSVGFKVYVDYFRAGTGIFKFLLLILVNVMAQACYVGSDWWLSRWSNQEEDKYAAMKEYNQFLRDHNIKNISNIPANLTVPSVPDVDSSFNVSIFSAIILAVFVFGLARALLFFKIAVDAAQSLHNTMFSRILRANISFFDTNPVGRILNRFSKDVGHMDDLLPVTFFDFVQCALLILGIVLVAGVVNPWVFIPTFPLAVLFVLVRKYYLQTSRSIKRLEGTSRSPVFSYLSASLQGLHTIRAMRMQERFMTEFDAYQDHHTEAWYLFLATSRWLAVRLDWLCALFVTAVTCCSVLAADTMNAGLVGLSITYTMTLMGLFQWGVRQSAEVENQMISVERVLEYSRLPMEADLESKPGKKPPPSWPMQGAIQASNVSLQYSPTAPYVLKNLNFSIHGMEKVGIVGRTGAGKSSLITTLFRMVEPEGTVVIDGINVKDIGLHDLRRVISIIPQDPVLFTGSLRKNLDPFQEYNDDQLWNALEEVKLKDAIKENTEALQMEVSEGGTNFSAGQRQLVCLARAVLGHTRILVIDEATANVDPITDELIQQTIRTKFKECTVLTIAHRLHTIIDSDRVMVLDAGSIVEMDTPLALLSKGEDQGGAFYSMVEQLGKAELDNLTEMARNGRQAQGDKEAPLANGVKPQSLRNIPGADATLQDVTQSLNDSTEDVDNTYKIEDIEESLVEADPSSPRQQAEEEEEEEDREETETEDRRHLLSASTPSTEASTASIASPAGTRMAGGEASNEVEEGNEDEDFAGDSQESETLLKSESKRSLKEEEVGMKPTSGDGSNDSIHV
ncbi:multidrug resistance-associated protein 4 [Plakobranchus ocellatus]|uniref:Multidrug resistance-associated protein 4 n=1 Tax=Plakobranchus ocellatus TaxID=259542 RepID=A0AAV3ZUK4_9GAST|nr:multidrug resistance-associated protein 4 [Plakobranchus ocellatus]